MVPIDDDKPVPESSNDRSELVSRIDELEQLLAAKKAETLKPAAPRMKFGTDGIPVLVDMFDPENIEIDENDEQAEALTRDHRVIEEIIDKVDQEISQDLDELIGMLKDSIIDEVKTRLLKELKSETKQSDPPD